MSAEGYLLAAREGLDRVAGQEQAIRSAGRLVADALGAGRRVVAFGTGHSHLIAEELYSRAGGLASVEAIVEPALTLDDPRKSSALEKLPGYGRILVEHAGIGLGDVAVVISNSGRNAVPVEFAEECRTRGATVVAITSVRHSGAFASRAPGGKRLMELADLVLDNGAPPGDAAVALPGRHERVGAISTVTGALLAQAVVVEAAHLLTADGHEPHILGSFNVDHSEV